MGYPYTKKIEIIKILNMSFHPDIIQIPINILDNRLYCDGTIKKTSSIKNFHTS